MAKGMAMTMTVLIVVVVLLHQTCNTTAKHHCPPSSCGSIFNISYPFRLTSDPENCGDQMYNLSCENNQTLVLHLYHGRYNVRQIDYTNYKIRVADPGIGLNANDYSFNIPLYLLDFKNFSDGDPYQISDGNPFGVTTSATTLYFMKCENPMDSQYYLNISPCIEDRVYSNSKRYTYAFLEFEYSRLVLELGDLCKVEQISLMTSSYSDSNYDEDLRNISCRDFYNELLRGFELYWFPVYCRSCTDCFLHRNTVICIPNGA
jgi:hypothetical protein